MVTTVDTLKEYIQLMVGDIIIEHFLSIRIKYDVLYALSLLLWTNLSMKIMEKKESLHKQANCRFHLT